MDDVGNLSQPYGSGQQVVTVDNTRPEIALLGENPVNIEWTLDYTDAGATASDTHDGALTHRLTVNNRYSSASNIPFFILFRFIFFLLFNRYRLPFV